MSDRATFPDLVLCVKQGEQDADAGFLRWELLHHLHPPLNLLEAPFNEVGCSYVLPSIRRMTHIGQTGIEILSQTLHESGKNTSVLLDESLGLGLCLHPIRRIVDPIESCFDQRPLMLGTLGLEVSHLVEEAALMLTVRESGSDRGGDPRAPVRAHHQDPFRVQPSTDQLREQGLPGFLALSMALDEPEVLPMSLLRDSDSAQGSLPADPLPAHLEVGPVNDEISKLLSDGTVQPPDQLPLDALVHPAHLGRTNLLSPEQMGDLAHLTGGDPSEKHLGDNLVDPLILPSIAAQDRAVTGCRLAAPGQAQILDEAEAGFELSAPRPVATVFSQRGSLVRLGANESEELVLGVFLEHLSHEISDSRLNVVQKFGDAVEPGCGSFIRSTCKTDLINGFFSC